MGNSSSIADYSASEIAHLIRSGQISAAEAVDAHIARIEAVNPRLNAVVVPLFDQARRDAIAADAAIKKAAPIGALHGVPITIKEQFQVLGTPTTFGLPSRTSDNATIEGPLVSKLRSAGAIILGKTNVSQALIFHESDNPVYGRTNNPWHPDRSPGGSSGGEAAIVAAGGSSLGLGADFGGSLRIPAHFCGVHSLRPTSWRFANDDTPAHLVRGGQEAILPQPGPIARSVADLAVMLAILATPIAGFSAACPPPTVWPDCGAVSARSLRVGTYETDPFFPVAPAVRRAVNEAADALRQAGIAVEPFAPPDLTEGIRLFLAVVGADGATWVRRMLGRDRPDKRIRGILQASRVPNSIRPLVILLLQAAGQRWLAFGVRNLRPLSANEYIQTIAALNHYRTRFRKAMAEARLDALICPPHALPALRHGFGGSLTVHNAAAYSVIYNVLGMPAGVVAATRVRLGEESDRSGNTDRINRAACQVERESAGLPIGVQVVGHHWREDVVLALMAVLETHFKMERDYPGLSTLKTRLTQDDQGIVTQL